MFRAENAEHLNYTLARPLQNKMTKTTQEIIQQIAPTLIEKAILVLLFALATVFGISLSPADPFTLKIIVLVAYVLLLSFAVYAFTAKKPSELATNVYRPVFQPKAKTAIIVVAILGLIPVYWSFIPYSMPELPIKIVNGSPTDVLIYSKTQFSVQIPLTPIENQDLATGYIQLHTAGETSISSTLTIPANGELIVWSEIIAPSSYRSFFEQGNTTLQIVISRVGGGFIVKQDIPFDMNTLKNYAYKVVIK